MSRFEPTYKGLKHSDVLGREAIEHGFEPTYKGLKPPLKLPILPITLGFEPTYKGLKPGAVRVVGGGGREF